MEKLMNTLKRQTVIFTQEEYNKLKDMTDDELLKAQRGTTLFDGLLLRMRRSVAKGNSPQLFDVVIEENNQ